MENEKLSLPQYEIPEGLEHAIAITTRSEERRVGKECRL